MTELLRTHYPARAAFDSLSEVLQFEVSAGKSLKIESSPKGEEFFNLEVPKGKKWTVTLTVLISEEDA